MIECTRHDRAALQNSSAEGQVPRRGASTAQLHPREEVGNEATAEQRGVGTASSSERAKTRWERAARGEMHTAASGVRR